MNLELKWSLHFNPISLENIFRKEYILYNKWSNRSMIVLRLGNYDRPIDEQTDEPTNQPGSAYSSYYNI